MPSALKAASLGVALILAGGAFGAPSLLVAGIGFLLLVATALCWVELARPRSLRRAPGPTRLVEGERYVVRIEGRAAIPLPGGEIRDSLLRVPVAVGPGAWCGWSGDVEVAGRGRRLLEPARLVVRDPLGIHTRIVETELPAPLLVLPRVHPVLAAGRGGGGRSVLAGGAEEGGGGPLDPAAIEPEVDGLRPYRTGSPASRIHWPAFARTGELHERRVVAGASDAPLVVLDSHRPASPDDLDEAVRAAASLTLHLARAGGCALLLPGARRPLALEPDLRGWHDLHARLALVRESTGSPAPAHGRGAVFWVTAAAGAHEERPVTGRRTGTTYLVSPQVAPGGAAVAFTVGRCSGIRLARASRKVARAA
jgi:uncharacterized protein (DUF58 family)